MASAPNTEEAFLRKYWVNEMDKKALGNRGEGFAAEFYKKLGFSITAQNYTCRGGEIDIIAENGEYIIFVEVKTRSVKSLYSPAEAVDVKKQKRLTVAAMKYLSENESEKQPQFDVFEVYTQNERIYKVNRIENAFEAFDFGGRYDIF